MKKIKSYEDIIMKIQQCQEYTRLEEMIQKCTGLYDNRIIEYNNLYINKYIKVKY